MIDLNDGNTFDETILYNHIVHCHNIGLFLGRYIIVGKTFCDFASHPKQFSLDRLLRGFAREPDTMQATDAVIQRFVNTNLFAQQQNLQCPESGRLCDGLLII